MECAYVPVMVRFTIIRKFMSKVLYITYDGILEPLGQSQVLNYTEQLSLKNQIYILSYEKRKDFNDALLVRSAQNRCREAGITWFPLPYHKSLLGTFFDILRGIFKAIFIRFKHKIEIVHCRSYLPALIGLLLKSIFIPQNLNYRLNEK